MATRKTKAKIDSRPGGAMIGVHEPVDPPMHNNNQCAAHVTKALSFERFRKSDRLKALLTGSSKSLGYSCNTFVVSDSLASIGEASAWSIEVSGYQGAPSLDLSPLRPRGSKLSTGGDSSGAASFSRIFDAVVGSMRRPLKKNGAGIVWLDFDHPDLDEFIGTPFSFAYKGIYIPGNHEPEKQQKLLADKPLLAKLTKAFDEGKAFICKRPAPCSLTGEQLVRNLCTEVVIPHRGGCILGVINLAQFDLSTLPELSQVFVDASLELEEDAKLARQAANDSPLFCNSVANVQFGLGVSGLASLLGNCGVTYEQFAEALEFTANPDYTRIWQLEDAINEKLRKDPSTANQIASAIIKAYGAASLALGNRVRRAFCVQPSATGAFECADTLGYVSTPELQPPVGLRKADGTYTIIKSALLGDELVKFSPNVETTTDVPFSTYAKVADSWQRILDSTGLAHSHSCCWYSSTGKDFTQAELEEFVTSARHNLYYRLPSYNPVALDKTEVGTGLQAVDDFSVDALLLGGSNPRSPQSGSSCGLKQEPGAVQCDCAG